MSSLRALLLPLLLSLACGGALPLGRVDEPVFVDVIVPMPGSTAVEADDLVAAPLEASVAGIPGLASSWSTSEEGRTELRLRFEGGTDPWAARAQVLDAVQGVHLPEQAEAPLLLSQRDTPVLTVVLRGESPAQASAMAQALRGRAVRLPGVLDAVIIGLVQEELQVGVDARRLESLDLAPAEVLAALTDALSNTHSLSDDVLIRVAPADERDPAALAQVVLKPGVHLGQVAVLRVEDLAPEGLVRAAGGGAVALVEVYGATPDGSPRAQREQRDSLLGALVGEVVTYPEAVLHLPEERARVALHAAHEDALQGVLDLPDLPRDAVLVPGSPPELWSWTASAADLAAAVEREVPGVEAQPVLAPHRTVFAVISGPDRDALMATRGALVGALEALPEVVSVVPEAPAPQPELSLQLDRERLAMLGLTTAQVTEGIRLLQGAEVPGSSATTLTVDGLGSMEDPASASLLLRTARGLERVPLASLATVTLEQQPARLDRVDSRAAELVSIGLSEGAKPSLLEPALAGLSLPTGVVVSLRTCPACP